MKKTISKISVVIFMITTILSCDESFSPKGEFEDGYSLFCVIDGNSSTQTAYLTKNYNPSDLNPQSYLENKSISGAELELIYPDTTYKFFDTTLTGDDGKSYTAYNLRGFKASGGNLQVKSTMPDGKVLVSNVQSTGNLRFTYETIRPIIYDIKGAYKIAFYDKPEPFYFSPKLFINYSVKKGNEYIPDRIEVASNYYQNGDEEIPVYPSLALRIQYFYHIINIEKTLKKITETAPDGSQFFITNLSVEILEVSEPLAYYYAITKTFNDGFTVQLNQPEYTNIEGGNGLFGYKYKSKLTVGFATEWRTIIEDMGYHLGN